MSASLLRQVLEPGFSRNRFFDYLASGEGQAVHQFLKLVQGLLADLKRVGEPAPLRWWHDPAEACYWLELDIRKYRARRRARVTAEELEVLHEHPVLGPLLVPRES